MLDHVDDGNDQVGEKNEKQNEMVRRVKPSVILEILRV
jgi:hypothetical protein